MPSAAGVGLVAGCDIAIAAQEAEFALSEARLGLIPATIAPYVVEAIGARQARRYFLTRRALHGGRGFPHRAVHDIVPSAALDERIDALLKRCSLQVPTAQRECKAFIRNVAHKPIDARMVASTAEHIATVRAFPEGAKASRRFSRSGGRRVSGGPIATDHARVAVARHLAARSRSHPRSGLRAACACTRCCSSSDWPVHLQWVDLPSGIAGAHSSVRPVRVGIHVRRRVLRRQDSGLDSIWDAVHTVIRIPAGCSAGGAWCSVQFLGDDAGRCDPWRVSSQRGSHLAKSGSRALINTSPEPLSNLDGVAGGRRGGGGLLWLAFAHPLVALAVVALLVVFGDLAHPQSLAHGARDCTARGRLARSSAPGRRRVTGPDGVITNSASCSTRS